VHNGNQTIRFGDFEADLHAGEIRKSGTRIKSRISPSGRSFWNTGENWLLAKNFSPASGRTKVLEPSTMQ